MATGQYNSFPIDWKSIDATKVPYSNATSGLSAADVQGAIDELNTDLNAIDASDIPYDNTASGLTADDVQEALDELASEKQDTLTAGDGIDITSDVISVETDSALTFATLPANAKAVGDALASIGETLKADFAPVITDTASGSIATFPDGADGYPLKEFIVDVDAVQDLHGYDHPWPAGGGKNKIDTRNIDFTLAGVRVTSDSDGIISLTGTRDNSTGWKVFVSFNLAPGDYVFSTNNTHVTCLLNYTQKTSTLTVSDGDVVRLALNIIPSGTVVNDTGIKCQIEEGSTPTAWTPYSNICPITGWSEAKIYVQPTVDPTAPPTVTIDLDGTRYGAVLDAVRGKLIVDRAMYVFTGNESPYVPAGQNRIAVNIRNTTKPGSAICSDFAEVVTANNLTYVYITTSMTADELKDYMANHTVQCVYLIATPIEVDLTPTEITTLLGTNNVFADTGDVEVEYCCSTKLFIEKKLAELA